MITDLTVGSYGLPRNIIIDISFSHRGLCCFHHHHHRHSFTIAFVIHSNGRIRKSLRAEHHFRVPTLILSSFFFRTVASDILLWLNRSPLTHPSTATTFIENIITIEWHWVASSNDHDITVGTPFLGGEVERGWPKQRKRRRKDARRMTLIYRSRGYHPWWKVDGFVVPTVC